MNSPIYSYTDADEAMEELTNFLVDRVRTDASGAIEWLEDTIDCLRVLHSNLNGVPG